MRGADEATTDVAHHLCTTPFDNSFPDIHEFTTAHLTPHAMPRSATSWHATKHPAMPHTTTHRTTTRLAQ